MRDLNNLEEDLRSVVMSLGVKAAAALILVLAAASIYVVLVEVWRPRRVAEVEDRVEVADGVVYLPHPRVVSNMTVEEALLLRRSLRDYTDEPVTVMQLSMVLWAAQGISEVGREFRTAPSAGATYPLEVYVVVGKDAVLVGEGEYLPAGVYKYDVKLHALRLVKPGDWRRSLMEAALNQRWVGYARVNLVICAVYERTTWRYGERGVRYVHIEVGHVGQNVYLMATALGLGTVAVGAFDDDRVAEIVDAEPEERPLYIMPIGVPVQPYKTSFADVRSYYESRRG